MKIFFVMLVSVFSLSSFASTRMNCPYILPDGSTEQGGGSYYALIKNDKVEVWHDPYQESDTNHPQRKIDVLKKIEIRNLGMEVYAANGIEFIKIRDVGILNFQGTAWSRTYSCELSK